MKHLYTPGREDDDSGFQVFGLQQQRCQVGVLAEEQDLLCLEDHRDEQQVRETQQNRTPKNRS